MDIVFERRKALTGAKLVPDLRRSLAIPLKYFTELPDPAHDLAATFNHARYTGWINLGGKRGPMHGVDSIGVRMRRAIGKPCIEIRNVTLSVEDPGDLYMEDYPAIDKFGQSTLVDYPEKVKSLEELEKAWRAEEAEEVSTAAYNYSKYGGYKQKQLEATGFFRTEKVDGRWWLVDPEGYLFLSVGVDCVNYGNGASVRAYEQRPNMYEEIPSQELMAKIRGTNGNSNARITPSIGLWNQYRRWGDNYREKAKDLIIKRMNKWGLNTMANWSSAEVTSMNRMAYILQLSNLGLDRNLMGLCDIYADDYMKNLETALQGLLKPSFRNTWKKRVIMMQIAEVSLSEPSAPSLPMSMPFSKNMTLII